jgi:hypothetical protein
VNKIITHLFFNLPINYFFAFTGSCSLCTWYLTLSNYINWHIIKFIKFYHYSGSNDWFSLKHVLNFWLSRTIKCTVFKARINNTRISQGALASLTCCAITSTTSLTTLVETYTIGSFLFLLWHGFLTWPILPQFEQVRYCLIIL